MWGQLAAGFGVMGFGVLLLWGASECRRGAQPRRHPHVSRTQPPDQEVWLAMLRSVAPALTVAGFGAAASGAIALGAFLLRAELLGAVAFLLGLLWGALVSCVAGVIGALAARRTRRGLAGLAGVSMGRDTGGAQPSRGARGRSS